MRLPPLLLNVIGTAILVLMLAYVLLAPEISDLTFGLLAVLGLAVTVIMFTGSVLYVQDKRKRSSKKT